MSMAQPRPWLMLQRVSGIKNGHNSDKAFKEKQGGDPKSK